MGSNNTSSSALTTESEASSRVPSTAKETWIYMKTNKRKHSKDKFQV